MGLIIACVIASSGVIAFPCWISKSRVILRSLWSGPRALRIIMEVWCEFIVLEIGGSDQRHRQRNAPRCELQALRRIGETLEAPLAWVDP